MPGALQFLILTVAAWLNREQQAAIDYVKRENEYLLERLPPGRLEITDAQCRRLANLGLQVSKSMVQRLLEEHGIGPPTETGLRWRTFLAAHWGHIYAADFMTVEVLTVRGLVRYHLLVVLDLASRVARLRGSAHAPGSEWVCNRMRELTNPIDGFLRAGNASH
jgi:hypothetical protein